MHVMDLGFVGKSTPVRKSVAYALQVPRAVIRMIADAQNYALHPPIIVNSIPKSGTHLLMQVARALPGSRYFGSFLAQQPSLTLRYRSQADIDRGIRKLVPGEVLGAHLHFTPETAARLRHINAVHLMIVRDPLDVLLSEAHYLRVMAQFHRMHAEFKNLSAEEAIEQCLTGSRLSPDIFPSFEHRIAPYCGWVDNLDCCVIRFEDTRNPVTAETAVRRAVASWGAKAGRSPDEVQVLVAGALEAIDPHKSHTFSNRKAPVEAVRSRLELDTQIIRLREMLGYRGSASSA